MDWAVIGELSSAVPWPYPEDGVEWFFEHILLPEQGKERWFWGLFLKDNPDELVGMVDVFRNGKPENRAFWLGKAFWGKGLMTEAVAPIMDYAFDVLGFETMVFSNAVGNVRSRRVKEKTGAVFLRVEPAGFVNPAYTHHEVFELTKEAWKKASRALE